MPIPFPFVDVGGTTAKPRYPNTQGRVYCSVLPLLWGTSTYTIDYNCVYILYNIIYIVCTSIYLLVNYLRYIDVDVKKRYYYFILDIMYK